MVNYVALTESITAPIIDRCQLAIRECELWIRFWLVLGMVGLLGVPAGLLIL